jgi:hypothetical protein
MPERANQPQTHIFGQRLSITRCYVNSKWPQVRYRSLCHEF